MKKITLPFLFLLLIILPIFSFAQQWKWAVSAGGSGNTDQCYDMATDSKGNAYWVGSVSGTATFGTGTNTATVNSPNAITGVIAKYDSMGAFKWVRKVTANLSGYDIICRGIAIDTSDRIFFSGYFEGNANFDGGIVLSNGWSTGDMFVARIDTTGTLLWAKKEGSSSYDDEGSEIAVDGSGNVYVAGYKSSNGYLWKFDSLGTKLWEKNPTLSGTVGSGKLRYEGISVKNGKILVCGYLYFISATYPSLPVIGGSSYQYTMLVEYDAAGNANWSKAYQSGEGYFYDVQQNTYGDILVTGMLRYNLFLPNDTITGPTTSNGDGIIICFDSTGADKWSIIYGNTSNNLDRAMQAVEAPNGRWYVSGQYYGAVTVGGAAITSVASSADVFVVRLNPLGQAEWIKSNGSSNSDYALCIFKARTGDKIYLGGYYWGIVTYGSTTIDDVLNGDAFMAQISDTTSYPLVINSIVTSPACVGSCNASATFSVLGSDTILYTLDSLQNNSGVFTNLCPGVYPYTISDGVSAPITDTLVIAEADTLNLSLNASFSCTQPYFILGSSVSGGSAPYSYSWSNGPTTDSIAVSDSTAASYSLIVTDENGCSISDTITIAGYSQATFSVSLVNDTLYATGDTSGVDFTWTFNNSPIAGSDTLLVYAPVQNGNYSLLISDSVCTWSSNTIPFLTALVKLNLNDNVCSIIPNPNNGSFVLLLNKAGDDIVVEISDITGKTVYKNFSLNSEKVTVDMMKAENGIYFLRVFDEGILKGVKKVVVAR